jgi:hypothetical protein
VAFASSDWVCRIRGKVVGMVPVSVRAVRLLASCQCSTNEEFVMNYFSWNSYLGFFV